MRERCRERCRELKDQYFLFVRKSDSHHLWEQYCCASLCTEYRIRGDMSRTRRYGAVAAVAALVIVLVTGCGVTRGDDPSGMHRLRMMVPNSPGGGYDLTARTAVKIMEDED